MSAWRIKGNLNQTPTVSYHSYFTVAVMTPQQDITFTMVGGGVLQQQGCWW